MVHVSFYPDLITLNDVTYQIGAGYYIGIPRQRGAGLGDFLRVLWRFAAPVLKDVGKEGLKSGAQLLTDVATGEKIKNAAKKHGRIVAANMLQNVSDKIRPQNGNGKKKKVIIDKKFPVGRSVIKKPRLDIFNGL